MSNTKTVMGQAANTQGIPLDITDVFSTYLYTGNSASQPINNGVDLNGEGGMVWLKARTSAYNNIIVDSERGSSNGTAYNPLFTNLTNAENTAAGYGVTSFDSNGFTLGPSSQQPISNQGGASYGDINYASWTFRKAPKFFDVVTFTGTGSYLTEIPHNLGVAPGMIIIKRINSTSDWGVWHRGNGSTDYTGLSLNASSSSAQINPGSEQYFTDTYFRPTYVYDDTNTTMNVNGGTYIAYLFAHNNGDGNFGPSGDQDIIKCGSYTGNGSSNGPEIDLGFEPQWLLTKRTNSSSSWQLVDVMRGMSSEYYRVFPDTTAAEDYESDGVTPTATGFKLTGVQAQHNASGGTYIYMAIRRGPLAQPESGTEVFATDHRGSSAATAAGTSYYSGFPVDMTFGRNRTFAGGNTAVYDRLRGDKNLFTDLRNAEGTVAYYFDSNQGFWGSTQSENTAQSAWMWKRAPGFCDVVAYTGDGTTARAIPHNLGVAPEMMFHKRRNASNDWKVPDFQNSQILNLNGNYAAFDTAILANYYGSGNGSSGGAGSLVTPDASTFTVTPNANVNGSGDNYIAYLFATLPGVSKVGSYTGNGTSQTIDCGFTSGARFILIKRTDSTGDWYVWDTERGIVAGNDPHLSLNTTAAEVTDDSIDPDNSGFIVNQVGATNINVSSATYIFYAVA